LSQEEALKTIEGMDEKVNLNVEYFKTVFCPLLPKRGGAGNADEVKVPINPGLPPSW